MTTELSLGLCLGACTLGWVLLEWHGEEARLLQAEAQAHDGKPQELLEKLLGRPELASLPKMAVTGRKYRNLIQLSSISEPEAVEMAYAYLKDSYPGIQAILAAGGETFMLYQLDSQGRVQQVQSGNKCASGTGEFFQQQIRRMDLVLEEAIRIADREHAYPLAGRCSVFCKSDCTHALNKGASKGRVVAGLARMIASKMLALLNKAEVYEVLLVGGVAQNLIVLHELRKELPGLRVAKEAPWFEALGAALWAHAHETLPLPPPESRLIQHPSSFRFFPPLLQFEAQVEWKSLPKAQALPGDVCVLGLDVGSTTTKAVVMRKHDAALLASVYLRTDGDPVAASKACYRSLAQQLPPDLEILALGVTGSGRQIAGLHALTQGIVNEILAHATAATFFDPGVDTLFEIGGQDAKYTSLCNRVATDYAMNEACSAGTGSFLEEAAWESLRLKTEEIAGSALNARRPPDFNDQCAAFIGSDIKTAIQEGLSREDIAAGLVYSVCQNYVNRVKGARPTGQRIFMQGGVCYNRAVPLAMAGLTGQSIVVPPEPGLMGAFGVALEVRQRLDSGQMQAGSFRLDELAQREVVHREPFTCKGGPEGCDLGCTIQRLELEGKVYPFGGSCNRYVNLRFEKKADVRALDWVSRREHLIFQPSSRDCPRHPKPQRIGLNKSLMMHTLYPLYERFFTELGHETVLSDGLDPVGQERQGAAFCYPVELAHTSLAHLLKQDLDCLFLPQVRGMFVESSETAVVCPLAQGEPYYLKAAFRRELPHGRKRRRRMRQSWTRLTRWRPWRKRITFRRGIRLLSPVLDFSQGLDAALPEFLALARNLGASRSEGELAFRNAVQAQRRVFEEMKRMGREFLEALEAHPSEFAVVLLGRPYNAFTSMANKGIPHKLASRGVRVLPLDFLPLVGEAVDERMYWAQGRLILQAARFVARHPQLYAVAISNFSCGPDSFLLTYVRDILGSKPSLTLELDSHTADAGLDTRIEAFLDIVQAHRLGPPLSETAEPEFKRTELQFAAGSLLIRDEKAQLWPLNHPRVQILIPSLGEHATRFMAASFRRYGIRARALAPPQEEALKLGRSNTSCKECLPLALVVGSCLNYLESRQDPEELSLFFLPNSSGPCRFGQYTVLLQNLLEKRRIPRAALLNLSCENGYAGLDSRWRLRAWQAILLADVLDDIHSAVLALSKDPESALEVFHAVAQDFEEAFEQRSWRELPQIFQAGAERLARIPRRRELAEAPVVGLAGEIFVRRDAFSRQYLVERLAERGIVTKVAHVSEWMYYVDYLFRKGLYLDRPGWMGAIYARAEDWVRSRFEKSIKKALAHSGFYHYRRVDVEKLLASVSHLVSPQLVGGDATLSVASALHEILDDVHGFILIGPFGCLPNRIAEAILSRSLDAEKLGNTRMPEVVRDVLARHPSLPFLAIEADGKAFPQLIQARLEAFCLQVERVAATLEELRVHRS